MPRSLLKKQALLLHRKLQGKIEIALKRPLKTKQDLNLLYTPGVAAVSSYLAENKQQLKNYTMTKNTVAVVSDGSAVLGLGNLGPEGALPVMEGKAWLFKALANIDAWPVVLNTQKTDEIISVIKAIAPGFGGINLEDIAAPRCFEIEKRLQAELAIPVFHDDQHGTAMVVLAGLINACQVVKKSLTSTEIVISGAGAAGQAITELLLAYGVKRLVLLDSRGIVTKQRKDLDAHKKTLIKKINPENKQGGLTEALVKADIFIGVSKADLLQAQHIKLMAEKPIVFALANPTPEIMPSLAKQAGASVVATGRSDFPNQINNSLGFPGIFRGALDNNIHIITKKMLVQAALNLAGLVKKPRADYIVPDMFDKRVVRAVAKAIKK